MLKAISMPARRRRRSLEIHAQAATAARASFGAPARASCDPTIRLAPMRRPRWPTIWRASAETSRARARPRSLSPSDRPPMSRSRPPGLRSSSPGLPPRLPPCLPPCLGPRRALRSRNLRTGQAAPLRRARCRKRVHCRKRAHFRKSGVPSRQLCLCHRRPHRCCSHLKSNKRSVAAPRAGDAALASLMTSAQSRQVRRLPRSASRARGELRQLPARRSSRLRPRSPRPRRAKP